MTERAKPTLDLLEVPSPSATMAASGRETIDPASSGADDAADAKVQKLFEIITAKSIVRNSQQKILSTRGTPQNWLIDLRKTFFDPSDLT